MAESRVIVAGAKFKTGPHPNYDIHYTRRRLRRIIARGDVKDHLSARRHPPVAVENTVLEGTYQTRPPGSGNGKSASTTAADCAAGALFESLSDGRNRVPDVGSFVISAKEATAGRGE
eukprot:scaffold105107_cov25-Tisochrysis_lutea.AAC.4